MRITKMTSSVRLERQKIRNRIARANETPGQRRKRLAVQKQWDKARRQNETEEERERRLASDREAHRKRNARLTDAERKAISKKKKARIEAIKKNETAAERESRLARQNTYAARHREKHTDEEKKRIAEQNRRYRERNKSHLNAKRRERLSKSPTRKVTSLLRCRVWRAIRSKSALKCGSTEKLVGLSFPRLMRWLESQFQHGMSWANYGQWHIDHIIPCAAFDLSQESQQLVAFNYRNLRPLWGKENIVKGDSVPVQMTGAEWTIKCVVKARHELLSGVAKGRCR